MLPFLAYHFKNVPVILTLIRTPSVPFFIQAAALPWILNIKPQTPKIQPFCRPFVFPNDPQTERWSGMADAIWCVRSSHIATLRPLTYPHTHTATHKHSSKWARAFLRAWYLPGKRWHWKALNARRVWRRFASNSDGTLMNCNRHLSLGLKK